jgi:hypothetical protein
MLAIYLTKLFFSNVLNKQSKALFCSWGSLTFFNVVLLDNLISMRLNDFGDLCEGNFLLGGFCHDPSADGRAPKTDFLFIFTMDFVHGYPYLLPNGSLWGRKIDLKYFAFG